MKGNAAGFVRLGAGLLCLVTVGWVLTGRAAKPANHRISVPTDWSHRHLIFSQPRSPEMAARLSEDPRYWQQIYRRQQHFMQPGDSDDFNGNHHFRVRQKKFHRDWAEDLGHLATAGAGNYPAKFSFDITTANCASSGTPDFTVFSTGISGGPTQASIVAYDNLYSGCSGGFPQTYWAYNLNGGYIPTSPVFSRDGTQLAFVGTNNITAHLVLLTWKSSNTDTVSLPTQLLPTFPASAYVGCTAPCMTTFLLTDNAGTTNNLDNISSVFYDYGHDIAWVGDSGGWLHQFTPVFNGIPAEVRSATWPLQVNPGTPAPLTNPVYDRLLDAVFVEDTGGILYRVDHTTGTVVASSQLDIGGAVVQGPVVDAGNGLVYVFVGSDGSAGCNSGANDCSGVFQIPANFLAGDVGTESPVGSSTATGSGIPPNPFFIGGFDNDYYTSNNATGSLYVCGNTGFNPTVYQVPIQTGVLGSSAPVSVLTANATTPACSPVTDFSLPGATASTSSTERFFVSVQGNSNCSGGGGCVMNFVDTPWQASKSFTAGQTILVRAANPANRYVNVALTAGTSAATQTGWSTTNGATKVDGTVTWINQGNPITPLVGYTGNRAYALHVRILDTNGNIQIVTTAGTSGASAPSWVTTVGTTTIDNGTLRWINAGALPTVGLPAAGGTSGIIVDNYVPSTTLTGASQVYFTTLSDSTTTCGSSPTGCAIQASQPALQ